MPQESMYLLYIVDDKIELIKKSHFAKIQKMTKRNAFLLAQMQFFTEMHRNEFVRYLENLMKYRERELLKEAANRIQFPTQGT